MGASKRQRRYGLLPVLTAMGLAVLAGGLLTDAAAVSEGVRRGLGICGSILIPALFPFMVLSGFLSITEYGRILSIPLGFVAEKLYKLPRDLGIILLLSMIGGYPVGAKMIESLLEQKRIDAKTAARMLCFCVNAGPSFLITAVGAGLFMDKTAGAILFATQTTATLLIGWLVSLRVAAPLPQSKTAPRPAQPGGATALVSAVNSACTGMLAMCGFAVLFSGLLSMVEAGGLAERISALLPIRESVIRAAISGLFEVTSGCVAAAQVGGTLSFGLTSAIVSFGGLSVLFQVMSCFGETRLRFRPMICARLVHMLLSTAMAVPLHRLLFRKVPVWLAAAPPIPDTGEKTTVLTVCLLAMSTIFLLSIPGKKD